MVSRAAAAPTLPRITTGERAFITFLVDWIVDTNPGDLMTNLGTLATHMTNNMPPKCEENLYRKQYGNLKECVLAGKGIMRIFNLDGTTFKFHRYAKVLEVQSLFEPAAFDKYLQGRKSYLQKHLTLAKQNSMNVCRRCEGKFYVAGNPDDACMGDRKHQAMYDWSKSDDVLLCEL